MLDIEMSIEDFVVFKCGVVFDVKAGLVSLFSDGSSIRPSVESAPTVVVTPYRETLPQLQLSLTYTCNMNCLYCSFRHRTSSGPVNMSLDIAFKAIDFFIESVGISTPYARIDFGLTGEPFLRHKLHDCLMERIQNSYKNIPASGVWAGPNTTNGTFFSNPDFANSIGPPQDVSCDGPKEVHDDFRKKSDGSGSYEDLEKNIKSILAKHPDIGVTAVLTAWHPNFDEIFLHLFSNLGFKSIYMKPVNVTPDVEYGLNHESIPLFAEGYTKLIDLIIKQEPDKMLSYLLALNSEDFFMRFFYRIKNCTMQVYRCGAGKSGIYVDTDGKLFPCAHFIGKKGWEIGNIKDGFDEEKRDYFKSLSIDSRKSCQGCWTRYLCGGGCHYQAMLANGDISIPDKAKCRLIRHLCSEAIRLFALLATQFPDVLSALPVQYHIDTKYIKAPPEQKYLPNATCGVSGLRVLNLASAKHVQGSLLPAGAAITLKMEHIDGILTVYVWWSSKLLPKGMRFWFLDLEAEPFHLADIPVAKPETRGILLRLNEEGQLLRAVPVGESVVKKIPYIQCEWMPLSCSQVKQSKQEVVFHLSLVEIFSGQVLTRQYGFNLFVEFGDGSQCSLTRFEPFCLVTSDVNGSLGFSGGEFESFIHNRELLNGSEIQGMVSIGRWLGLHANVC